jgi:pSer/pThr/pTyr-binding forkhead associated (FHA) protein
MSESALNTKPSAGFQVTIRITAGPNKGEVYRLLPPGAIVGRDPLSCQVALADARVSRQQFRLDYKMEGLTIEDISGKNTTQVNQKLIFGEHLLASGDVIQCGDSQIAVEIQLDEALVALLESKKEAALLQGSSEPLPFPAIPHGALPTYQKNNEKNPSQSLYIIIGVGLLAAFGLWMIPEDAPKPPPKIATAETLNEAISATQKRQEELQKATSSLTELDLYNKRSAQKHYIRGFRDYQNGRYSRAMEAFQTALATDRNHAMARRYYKLAEKKRLDEVDYRMDLGLKYKDKAMYKMCIAEFEQVLQILNQPSHKKYQLAKEQMKECRLSIQEGL